MDSVASDITSLTRLSGYDDEQSILDAVGRAKVFKLCLRRIWAVAASLPDKERSLPGLIPPVDTFTVPSHSGPHHEHEQCTFGFCEHSRIDFTSVSQHHECDDTSGCGSRYVFNLPALDQRVERGTSTAWKLVSGKPDDVPSLLDPTQPYMAVSHVWADGTGAGNWPLGEVNRCLYDFFCGIARSFQCEGCWWDAVSIPRNVKARSKALTVMHNNYADARITLVHDLYLRKWDWVDAPTACFAIAMSPWYSRGWTALELAKSHKVKIMFNSRDAPGYVIKDLDIDILEQVPEISPHFPMAKAISRLRNATFDNLSDLLSTLVPRDTSRPRDVPIISGLLAGVDVSGGLSQQEVYQRILRKFGKVAQGHLFHNSATMAALGFSWCPTNITDMPLATMEAAATLLDLKENGDLEGTWNAYPIDTIPFPPEDFIWHNAHDITDVALRLALSKEHKDKHILLTTSDDHSLEKGALSGHKALVVQPMECEGGTDSVVYCRFVGPVYFHTGKASGRRRSYDGRRRSVKVRISNSEKMRELDPDTTAWSYVLNAVDGFGGSEESPDVADATNGQDEGAAQTLGAENSPDAKDTTDGQEDGAEQQDEEPLARDPGALLFFRREADLSSWRDLLEPSSAILQPAGETSSETQGDKMIMRRVFVDVGDSSASVQGAESVRAFFYGSARMIGNIKDCLEQPKSNGELWKPQHGRMLFVCQDEDNHLKSDVVESTPSLGRKEQSQDRILSATALHLVAKQNKETGPGLGALVALLLDAGAPYVPDSKGQLPIYLALSNAKSDDAMAKSMLTHKKNAADPNEVLTVNWERAIHFAAVHNRLAIAQTLIELGPGKTNLDAQDVEGGLTALIVASKRGHSEIAALLLKNGATTTVRDYKDGRIALHHAADSGHRKCVEVLLNHAEEVCRARDAEKAAKEAADDSVASNSRPTEGPEAEVEGDGRNQPSNQPANSKPVDPEKQRRERVSEEANVNWIDRKDRMPLHLASQNGYTDIVETLVEWGAAISKKDSSGSTALMLAVGSQRVETVNKLLGWQGKGRDRFDQHVLDASLLSAVTVPPGKLVKNDSILTSLLDNGAKVGYSKAPDGKTALHWAVSNKTLDVATKLIEHMSHGDALLNKTETRGGQSALIMAVDLDQGEIANALLDKGADVTIKDFRSRTVLHWAAIRQNLGISQRVLDMTRDTTVEGIKFVDVEDRQDRTALHCAAQRGYIDIVKILTDDAHANTGIRDVNGQSALMSAAAAGRASVVKWLIPKSQLKASEMTALDLAAANGRQNVVDELLDSRHLRLDERMAKKALEFAAREGHLSVAMSIYEKMKRKLSLSGRVEEAAVSAMLLSAATAAATPDADVDTLMKFVVDPNPRENVEKQTALMLAVVNCNRHLVDSLLSLDNVKIDMQDDRQRTALILAVIKAGEMHGTDNQDTAFHIVDSLLKRKPDLNLRDDQGYTALHHAAEAVQPKIVAELMRTLHRRKRRDRRDRGDRRRKFELDLNVVDQRNRTALHIVLERIPTWSRRMSFFSEEMRAFRSVWADLIRFGTPLDIKDTDGQTPLHRAVRRNQFDVAEMLFNSVEGQNFRADTETQGRGRITLDIADNKKRTPLLLAAERGLWDMVTFLLRRYDFEIDAKDDMGRTTLLLAAEGGGDKAVESLLEKDANANLDDDRSRTPLLEAARNGHSHIVEMLLGPGQERIRQRHGRSKREKAEVNARDDLGRTALMLAAENGRGDVIQCLLNSKANLGLADNDGKMAWERAMSKGHVGVVRTLLSHRNARNQDLTRVNKALLLAGRKGWTGLVEIILAEDADVTFQDESGSTALHLAAIGGHVDVVKILLKKGVDVAAKDGQEHTALMLATEHGFESIVETLLGVPEGSMKKDITDCMGPESLLCAAEKGNLGIVKLLLGTKVDVDATDAAMRTAMALASANGSDEIVRLLLRRDANPALKDMQGRTPLHYAAWGGHKKVVERLLGHAPDKLINLADDGKQTPLHLAAERASTQVVELLLAKGANPDARSRDGQTALHRAAWGGSCKVIELLRRKGADLWAKDDENKEPWQVAAEKGHEVIVQTLLEGAENMPAEMVAANRSALIFAAEKGYTIMAKALLDRGADATSRDQDGLTPLHWAAGRGDYAMAELLINFDTQNTLVTQDSLQRMPLCLAVLKDRVRVVRLLLAMGADPNARGDKGRTLLHIAAQEGFSEVAQVLSDHGADLHARDERRGQKAWFLAAEKGHHQIAETLLEREVNFNPQSPKVEELFLHAAKEGFVPTVRLLLKKKVDKDARDQVGRTALALAAEHGKADVVKLLLYEEALVDVQDSNRQSPLLWAAQTRNMRILNLLLDTIPHPRSSQTRPLATSTVSSTSSLQTDSDGDDDSRDDSDDEASVHIRYVDRDDESGSELSDRADDDRSLGGRSNGRAPRRDISRPPTRSSAGESRREAKDILTQTNSQGRTPLHVSIHGDNDEAVRLLITKAVKLGITLDTQDSNHNSALHLVASLGKETLVQALTKARADPLIQDALERTPLLLAVQHGHDKVVDALLPQLDPGQTRSRYMRSLVTRDSQGRLPIHVATEKGYSRIVEKLLEFDGHRVDIEDMGDKRGRTPLIIAAENGNIKLVQILLAHNALQYLTDDNKRTPLLVAAANGDYAMARMLIGHRGADFRTKAKDEKSLLDLAVDSGNRDLAWLVAHEMNLWRKEKEKERKVGIVREVETVREDETVREKRQRPELSDDEGAWEVRSWGERRVVVRRRRSMSEIEASLGARVGNDVVVVENVLVEDAEDPQEEEHESVVNGGGGSVHSIHIRGGGS